MKRSVYSFSNHSLRQLAIAGVLALLAAGTTPAVAQNRAVRNYLTLGFGGGEANTILSSERYETLKNKAGGDAQLNFGYEFRHRSFFMNLGLNLHYTYTGQKQQQFIDAFQNKTDHDGEKYTHRYVYTDFVEQQNTFMAAIPLQMGFYIRNKAYISFGMKASFPVLKRYETETMLQPDGLYPASYWYRDPLTNNDAYGFYAKDKYTFSGTYHSGAVAVISPTLEAGWLHYLTKNRRYALRLGMYFEYAFPLAQNRRWELTDYSYVNQHYETKPATFSQDDLSANLKVNSVLDNRYLKSDWNRMSIGVKATFLFLLKKKHVCVTCDDDSGIDYYPPKGHTGSTRMSRDPFQR